MNIMRSSQFACGLVLFALPSALCFADELNVYFGNLHAHTSYSDGSGFPAEAFKYAKEKGHLDFMALTEHNHAGAEGKHKAGTPYDAPGGRKDGVLIGKNPALYNAANDTSVIGAAKKATKDGVFVALYGQEVSTISSGNHVNVFEVSDVIDVPPGEFDKLLQWLDTHPDSQGKRPILQFNHPVSEESRDAADEYGRDDFGGEASWLQKMGAYAKTMEILCGPGTLRTTNRIGRHEEQYWDFLNLGFRVAPTGDQDNHYKTWGTLTDARTAVVAPALTKKDVLDAIRARHVYATDDPNLKVIGKVNGHLCGEEIPRTTGNLTITVAISNADDPQGDYTVYVYGDTAYKGENAKVVKKKNQHGNGIVTISDVSAALYKYVAIVVKYDDDDGTDTHAWLAPVWFD